MEKGQKRRGRDASAPSPHSSASDWVPRGSRMHKKMTPENGMGEGWAKRRERERDAATMFQRVSRFFLCSVLSQRDCGKRRKSAHSGPPKTTLTVARKKTGRRFFSSLSSPPLRPLFLLLLFFFHANRAGDGGGGGHTFAARAGCVVSCRPSQHVASLVV